MSRVIAAYDLDEDHGRLWVNADLKRMPEIVVVANQPMDRAQTVTYAPEARLLEALGENKRVESENAKLREELAKARDPQRIGGQADPSSFAYAIEQLREFRWQHATNDVDAIPYINNVAAAHEYENAKLREDNDRLVQAIEELHSVSLEDRLVQLENDNADLRELCADLMRTAQIAARFGINVGRLAEQERLAADLRIEV